MTPDDWARMSWHSRQRMARRVRHTMPCEPHEHGIVEHARWLLMHIVADPPEVIAARQEFLHNLGNQRKETG
jgi:hypothetical protein